jgi:hypothetical protein
MDAAMFRSLISESISAMVLPQMNEMKNQVSLMNQQTALLRHTASRAGDWNSLRQNRDYNKLCALQWLMEEHSDRGIAFLEILKRSVRVHDDNDGDWEKTAVSLNSDIEKLFPIDITKSILEILHVHAPKRKKTTKTPTKNTNQSWQSQVQAALPMHPAPIPPFNPQVHPQWPWGTQPTAPPSPVCQTRAAPKQATFNVISHAEHGECRFCTIYGAVNAKCNVVKKMKAAAEAA